MEVKNKLAGNKGDRLRRCRKRPQPPMEVIVRKAPIISDEFRERFGYKPPRTVLLQNEEEDFIKEVEVSKKQMEELFSPGESTARWIIEITMFGKVKFIEKRRKK